MPKRQLTATYIAALLPAPAGQRADHWDTLVPGFGVRVTDRGAKSYVLYARYPPSRKPARRALGDTTRLNLAAARQMARAWLDLIAQGKDPAEIARQERLAARRTKRITFAVVAEDWLRAVVIGKQRKATDVARDTRRLLVTAWRDKPITEITTRDVRDLIGTLTDTPGQARNTFSYAKRLFAWAVTQDYGLETDPTEKITRKDLVGIPAVRQRVLTDDELRAVWHASGKLGYPYGPLMQMLALTGQRKSEVAQAHWSEFDLQQNLWTIPAARMKGNAPHVVPLTADVVALLAGLPRFRKGDCLFSTTYGAKPVNGFAKSKRQVDALMAGELDGSVDHWVIHDIRRTMRTHLSALPIPDRVRELVIAHAQPGLHRVYDQHSYINEKRHALELWQARLRNIVSPPEANVVPFAAPVA
jgi:integrase